MPGRPGGSSDQLSVGDDLLVALFNRPPDERPAALFMTGDQIYADDVAGQMLEHLIRLANELTGFGEIMPRCI